METTVDEHTARKLRRESWVHGVLGVVGLVVAAYLIYPKAHRLLSGDPRVLGRGAVANVALLFGSLMFLRNARHFRRRIAAER